jgi:SAM-dependent methyltransferase
VKELRACPLCGETGGREFYRFEPARWIPGSVVRCPGCQLLYKQPAEAAKPVAEYYQEDRYHDHDYWSREHAAASTLDRIRDSLLKTLGPGAGRSLLDVGCGPGLFLERAREAGFAVTGVELNPELARRARERAPGGEIVVSDFTQFSSGRRFDVITMLDLIEHLPDPLAALRRAREMLNPGGHIVLYTPNHRGVLCRTAHAAYRLSGGLFRRPVVEIFDCLHVVFFDVPTLDLALRKSAFQVVGTTTWGYDPERSVQAPGIWSLGARGLEAVGGAIFGRFRILMFGKKPAPEPAAARPLV